MYMIRNVFINVYEIVVPYIGSKTVLIKVVTNTRTFHDCKYGFKSVYKYLYHLLAQTFNKFKRVTNFSSNHELWYELSL